MAGRESGRNPRLRLACARCQRRKIRCDALLPSCTNCRKAGTECRNGESLRLRNVVDEHDGVMSRLQRRVAWLESIIKERLPDVDLAVEAPYQTAGPREQSGARTSFVHTAEQDLSMRDETPSLQQSALLSQAVALPDQRAHEIGLVSVGVNADQRYLGPSSGYFLARLLLNCSPVRLERHDPVNHDATSLAQSLIHQLVQTVSSPLPLPDRDQAKKLARVYFETVHPQYPILHEHSLMHALDSIYDSNTPGKEDVAAFQVNMVLAIASSILSSRIRSHIPGESYCLSALQHLERINVHNFSGLQCVLLLLIFTMYSPNMRLNVWYLNYHCIAAVLDLGLQRNITTASGISLLDQEMRTRVFWTVFTLDRTIATMMGRPIGLRDEACELRLPHDLEDHALTDDNSSVSSTGNISLSIHLFKLTKINSEIKYVANSIVRDVPMYAYPPVPDIHAWQKSMLEQLDHWVSTIPQIQSGHEYVHMLSKLRYYSMRILLLRPSPALPRPSIESLVECYDLAWQAIRLYDELYRKDMLVHDWIALHGILYSTITALYCIRAVPDLARRTELEDLMSNMMISLSLISVAGERWSGAKRSRQILDDLGRSTIKWMKSLKTRIVTVSGDEPTEITRNHLPLGPNISDLTLPVTATYFTPPVVPTSTMTPGLGLEDSFWADLPQHFDFGDFTNVDSIMHSLFEDFVPQTNSTYN